ncbi:MAG: hypothetical protein K8S55_04585 [Phycisphaerae bacterium]|nr:hypothetical protein [Phycisphaerae bacterium]
MRKMAELSLIVFLGCLAGCDTPQPSGQQCFKWSTELDLPPGVTCLNAKTITVAFIGDTYYLKLKSEGDLTSFLNKHFSAETWDSVQEHMMPPEDWQNSLPFWNQAEMEGKTYYSGSHVDNDETTFVSYLSYDKETGIIYFVGMQCWN